MLIGGYQFSEVTVFDFEYEAPAGERPTPVCLVARLLVSGRVVRLWRDELYAQPAPPFPFDKNTLLVGFYTAGDLSCFRALGWPRPERIVDAYAEFRDRTSGLELTHGKGLLGALHYYGENAMSAEEKEGKRNLVLRGGPWTSEERAEILAYCEVDVNGCERVLRRLAADLDLPRALVRGRYMWSVSEMEWNGVPLDTVSLQFLRDRWDGIKEALIRDVDRAYGVFDDGVFKIDRFAAYLARHGIPWPFLPSGMPDLDKDVLRDRATVFPHLEPLRQLRVSLSSVRLFDLPVGRDGRNRCMLSPFATKTSRNAPRASEFIYAPSVWIRKLIQAEPGLALAYVDYEQEEFGIAAALSGDENMARAYRAACPYIEFAQMAGAAPPGATKTSHPKVRKKFKTAALAVQYGQGAHGLAMRLGCGVAEANALLSKHRNTFPKFWRWSDLTLDGAMLYGWLRSPLGWTLRFGPGANPRTGRNFPMQAAGADILRVACELVSDAGVEILRAHP